MTSEPIPSEESRKHRRGTVAYLVALTVVAAGLLGYLIATDRSPSNPEKLVRDFVSIVRDGALRAEGVEWEKVTRDALAELPANAVESDVYRAYGSVLSALGDKHTIHIPRSYYEKLSASPARGDSSTKFTTIDRDPDGILRITVRGYQSVNSERFVADGLSALKEIEGALAHASCGVIVDLWENTGGNMFPMFIALLPFLGNGDLMKHVDRHGKSFSVNFDSPSDSTRTLLGNGADDVRGAVHRVSNWNEQKKRPIAVLQYRETGSSGEATLIALKGRPWVKTFGTPTAGFATGNTVIPLADGSALALTVSRMADRNRHIYEESVAPDVSVFWKSDAVREATNHVKSSCTSGV